VTAPETERQLVARILALKAAGTTTMADEVLRIPATNYTSEDHARIETDRWFAAQPGIACLAGDLGEAGDYLTTRIGGIPVVVVRGADGRARAFENICRHRASPVASGRGHRSRSFTCIFHGWVYDATDGHLVAQPRSCDGFDGLDRSTLGLRPLATAEHHGMVLVDPRRAADQIDAEGWLGDLAGELATHDYGRLVPFRTRTRTWQCNWKLLLDTYFESYHVSSLHRESLGAAYTGIASPADGFGPHNRIVVPMASIFALADQPADTWALAPHAVVQYFIAPNTILSHLYGRLTVWQFNPLSAGVTEVVQSLYTEGPVIDEVARAGFDRQFDAEDTITAVEDFPESELVQANLATGRVEATVIGRNEAGMIVFHRALEHHLAQPGEPGPAEDRVNGRLSRP
jgi:phenylpropionate dioxygenase-like ring-hydroxylating dioxygenase large terminal subunit